MFRCSHPLSLMERSCDGSKRSSTGFLVVACQNPRVRSATVRLWPERHTGHAAETAVYASGRISSWRRGIEVEEHSARIGFSWLILAIFRKVAVTTSWESCSPLSARDGCDGRIQQPCLTKDAVPAQRRDELIGAFSVEPSDVRPRWGVETAIGRVPAAP